MPLLPSLAANRGDGPILIFAPERIVLDRLLLTTPRSALHTTDLFSTDVDAPGEDIQQLRFPSASFAMIVCNHVLEHVPDDRRAINECARVLRPGGVCVFTIPGDFHLRKTRVIDPPDGNGHRRHYGMEIVDVLRGAFGSVDAIDMNLGSDPRWRVRKRDYAFVCRHLPASHRR